MDTSAPDEITIDDLMWDYEVCTVHDILTRKRKGRGFPDKEDIPKLEGPLTDVVEMSHLFLDLVDTGPKGAELSIRGLGWLAASLHRSADQLHRLYLGGPPKRQ